ncbi:MAG: RNA polymerase sigma factor [Ruminococcus sp.]|nr:RNA polymerase sigma factor [Ruminococcus sp.]
MREKREKRFEEIYMEYKDTVFAISIMYLKDYQLAEDAAQEVFVKVLKKLNSLKDKSKTKAWISKIAINVCRNKLKHSSRREIPYDTLPQNTQNDIISDIDFAIDEALSGLSPELNEVVILYYYQGFTQKEISSILNIPTTTTAYRLRTAKSQLKKSLKEYYNE